MMAGAASGLERSRGVIGQEGVNSDAFSICVLSVSLTLKVSPFQDLITKHSEYCELLLQPKVRAITEACCTSSPFPASHQELHTLP